MSVVAAVGAASPRSGSRPSRRAARPAAIAASSKACARSMPAACARRTRVGAGREATDAASARAAPGHARARRAGRRRGRCSDPSGRARSGRAPRTGCVVPPRASSASRSATPAVPAGSSCAVGSSRTRTDVPMATMLAIATRCCSPPDSANGSRSARWPMRQAGQRGVDPRVHLGPGHAQVLEAERQLLADRQLRGRQLVGRRREDDPDPAEQRAARRGRGVDPVDGDPAVELGPHDPRDEPGGSQREGRLAGSGPAGHAHLAAGRDREIDTATGSVRGGPGTGRRGPRSGAAPRCRRRRRRGHRGTIPNATSSTPTAASTTSSRSQRSIGGSATTR